MKKSLWQFLTEGVRYFTLEGIRENWLALLIILILSAGFILFLVFSKKKEKSIKKFDTRVLVVGSLCVSLAFILSLIKPLTLPQGGDITLVSGLPIILFAYLYGPRPGFIAAFSFSFLFMLQGVYTVGIIQFLLDYPLAFMAFGLAGFFRKEIRFGILAGYLTRLLFHTLSGIFFFGSTAKELGYAVIPYAFLYNAIFLIPEMILCIIIVSVPQVDSMIERLKEGLRN